MVVVVVVESVMVVVVEAAAEAAIGAAAMVEVYSIFCTTYDGSLHRRIYEVICLFCGC